MQTGTAAAACPKCGSALGAGSTCPRCGPIQQAGPPKSPASVFPLRANLVLLLFAVFLLIAAVVYVNVSLLQSSAYTVSLQTALSSPDVQSALGSGIRAKQPVLGFLFPFGGSQFAQWSVILTGSRGSGHLYGVANWTNGAWDFSRLSFEPENGKDNDNDKDKDKDKVELTPVRPLQLPTVPAKNVYLIPIGLAAGESLQWAPAYYKARLGIDVKLLPAIPLDPKLIDPARNQLNTDKWVEFLAQKYPEISRDPASILLGVTSSDMYIPGFVWSYTENMRHEGRYGMISSARLHPPSLLGKWNPEWLTSRVQKLLTKNLVMLYFDLPLSSDYTSLLSGGVLSGIQIDRMGGEIVGAEGRWHSFVESGDPAVTIYDGPANNLLWKMQYTESALPDTSTQVFCVDAGVGLIMQRKADFAFGDEPALQFTRVYRNQDDRSRSFGIGGSDSFEIFLGGQMGVAIDLIMEDGLRIHYNHLPPATGQTGDTYQSGWGGEGRFQNTQAVFDGKTWRIKTADGWTYMFPYTPNALPQNVTVLTGFSDPEGNEYKMERDSFGALLSISSPSGKSLHFENDSQHRISKVTSSQGRTMQYEYDASGRMIRATDSVGHVDSYTYDDKGQMISAGHGTASPILTNKYFPDGYIKSQVMGDGKKFEYSYFRRERNVIYESLILDPNGLETYVQYVRGGYLRSLPSPAHRGRADQ
jgi:YD repeat-containing protein